MKQERISRNRVHVLRSRKKWVAATVGVAVIGTLKTSALALADARTA
jgi:hypothetical protein